MNNLVDEDGENMAVRAFLQQFQGNHLITSGQMLQHLKWLGFDLALPEWANPDLHITAGEAQAWLRLLFTLETDDARAAVTLAAEQERADRQMLQQVVRSQAITIETQKEMFKNAAGTPTDL